MNRQLGPSLVLIAALTFSACTAQIGGGEPEPGAPPEDLSTYSIHHFPEGTTVKVCNFPGSLPLRQEPSPGAAIIRLMPLGTTGVVRGRLYAWHKLDVAGRIGWAYGTALCLVKQGPSEPKPQGTFLRFVSPRDGQTLQNGFWLRLEASGNIRRVEYWADHIYRFAESANQGSGFSHQINFNKTGKRVISARAYDEQNRWLIQKSITVTITDNNPAPGSQGGNLAGKLPYFYQYNNKYSPGASCQNTSMAMVLKYYGWNGTPDTITARFGKNSAQSPAGLASIFNQLASEMGSSRRLRAHTDGRVSNIRALLGQGKPVIVHGYFTGSGHVIVLTGYNGSHYTANDPAGRWNQAFKGGYSGGSSSGRAIKYSAAALEKAIVSTNGYNSVPIWYHEVR